MCLLDEKKIEDIKSLDPVGDFIAEVMQDFCRDATTSLENMQETAKNATWEAYRDAAHALKSVAGSVGASTLDDRGSEAMRAGDKDLAENAARYAEELEVLYQESRLALLKAFEIDNTPG